MTTIYVTGATGRFGTIFMSHFQQVEGVAMIASSVKHLEIAGNLEAELTYLAQQKVSINAILHLAWTSDEHWKSERLNTQNIAMAQNVLVAAKASGIDRVIIASSVHATDWRMQHRVTQNDQHPPGCVYGISKRAIEQLGLLHATQQGLDVIVIRFGGMSIENSVPTVGEKEPLVWLSKRDGCALIEDIADCPMLLANYTCINAVSNNHGRVHDVSNPFGWKPQDGVLCLKKLNVEY